MTNKSKLPKSPRFSAEVRERAVRMVQEHRSDHASQWAAIVSISTKIGCTAETLRRWVHEAGRNQRRDEFGQVPTPSADERLRQLERENRELRQANEILRKASAYFAQAELDRRPR
jgi:transposase